MTPREMLARPVAFPTVPDTSHLDVVDFAGDHHAGHGVPTLDAGPARVRRLIHRLAA